MDMRDEIKFKLSAAIAERNWLIALHNLIVYDIKNGNAENQEIVNVYREYMTLNGMGSGIENMESLSEFNNYIYTKICEVKKRLNSIYGEKARLDNADL